jgi:predicted transcriptional regulator
MTLQTFEMSAKRRDRLDIIAQIMEIANQGTFKTQIMYKANLSFAQLNIYLKRLTSLNLLAKTDAEGREIYTTTEKGLDFLQRHQELIGVLNDDESIGTNIRSPPATLFRKNVPSFCRVSFNHR